MARGLPPEQVAHIKRSLLEGVAPATLARLYGLNVETVRRYGRGESRVGVVVEGEAAERKATNASPIEPVASAAALASLETLKKLLENGDGQETPFAGTTAAAPNIVAGADNERDAREPRERPPAFGLLDEC